MTDSNISFALYPRYNPKCSTVQFNAVPHPSKPYSKHTSPKIPISKPLYKNIKPVLRDLPPTISESFVLPSEQSSSSIKISSSYATICLSESFIAECTMTEYGTGHNMEGYQSIGVQKSKIVTVPVGTEAMEQHTSAAYYLLAVLVSMIGVQNGSSYNASYMLALIQKGLADLMNKYIQAQDTVRRVVRERIPDLRARDLIAACLDVLLVLYALGYLLLYFSDTSIIA